MVPDEIMLKFKHSKIEPALQYVSYHCGQWHEIIDAPAVNQTKNNIATLTIEYSSLQTFNNQSVTAPMARPKRKGKGENPYIVNTSRVSGKNPMDCEHVYTWLAMKEVCS